jgi:hypothetical protein
VTEEEAGDDPQEMKAAYACFDELLDEFAKHGYGDNLQNVRCSTTCWQH